MTEEFLKKYSEIVMAVREAHESRKMAHGHDFDHALAVANLAGKFCESSGLSHIAWLAGICHNADRMVAFDSGMLRREVPDESVERLVGIWFNTGDLSLTTKSAVVLDVLAHGRPNESDDSLVLRALKDADRVVNARLDIVIRCGQLQADLPALDPVLLLDDKRGKYNGRLTVLADIVDCLDWGNLEDERFGVRTPGAKAMITTRVEALRKFLELLVEQRREEGLVPYPLS